MSLGGGAGAASLIVNGGFEDGVHAVTQTDGNGTYTNNEVPNSWMPSIGFTKEDSYNTVDPAEFFPVHSGGFSLQMGNYNQETGGGPDGQDLGYPATLSQTFGDVAGQTYQVKFWVNNGGNANAPFDKASVSVGAAGVTVPGPGLPEGWLLYSFLFAGTGSDTITIAAQSDFAYWFIDDVSVQAASAAPVPAALPLFASGLGLLAAAARRKRKKSAAA